MQLRNCSRCGKVFMCVSVKVCPACQKELDQELERIRDYVKANPGATVIQICDALEVDQQLVEEFIEDSRYGVVTTGLSLECKRCGAPIQRGRYCEACAADLSREMQGVLPDGNGELPPSSQKRRPDSGTKDKLFVAQQILKDSDR